MSESLNVVRAKSYEARPKAGRATVPAEAGRQRGSVDPRRSKYPDAKPQARTYSEPRCSIVSETRSNAVSGSAEPLDWRRRHHPSPIQARVMELPGVAGRACGEGCSGEGGRSGIVRKVRGAISATREECSDAVPEVRGDDSSGEPSVMDGDAKRPHFDGAAGEVTGSSSRPEGA